MSPTPHQEIRYDPEEGHARRDVGRRRHPYIITITIISIITILQPRLKHNTTETPVFQSYRFCKDNTWHDAANFGEPGYGVLHPATPASISQGAEDLGEMGAYHHAHHRLADEAVLDKLTDFLPVGQEAVLIQDPRLHAQPPQQT